MKLDDETTLDKPALDVDAPGTLPSTASQPTSAPPEAAEDPNVGRRIGPYRIEHLIARGGMGRVYLATREADYEQRVALKLIETGKENLDVLDRFYRERQILASLEHPNVARILDGGTTDDALPFFVMEYVEGEPVDRYCEDRGLSLAQRLALFQEICQAVHFAHQNLVVHRDLKPGNILVTQDGVPKLLDFGIAKLLDTEPAASHTRPGKRPMTPAYASPEQLRGEAVTTASDVYSLGVLLYRLVSGRPPYRLDEGPVRATELICEVEPPPPSAVAPRRLRRRLAGDVDAVVLKAMSKEPERRYASAWQLAEDVRCHLAGLPVAAHPGTWLHRAGKSVRRHKLGWAVAVLILTFAVTTTVLWRRSVAKERQTAAARHQAEDALLRAEKVSELLEELFESADPDAGNLTVREVLDRGRERLTGKLEDEPEIRADLLGTLGTVYNNLGFYSEARELKEEALRTHLEADPSDRSDLAADLNNLGRLLYDLGDYPAAADRFREALAMWQRLTDDANVVRGLRNLAGVRMHQGQHQQALTAYRKALDIQRDLHPARGPEIAMTLHSLGTLYRLHGEPERAEPFLREALEIFSESYGPSHTRVAAAFGSLGRVLHTQGRTPEARECYAEALRIRRQLLGDDNVKVAVARKNLAAVLLDEGDTERAGTLLEAALATLRRTEPAGDWTLATTQSVWGSYLAARGRFAEAETYVLSGYRTLRDVRGPGDATTRDALQRVIGFYETWGKEDEAAAYRAIAVSPPRLVSPAP